MTDESTQISQPSSITDLAPKMCLQGNIRETRLHGAVVDIGLEYEGLLHISQLSSGHVDHLADVVRPGDTVTVWVTDVYPEQGRISLTMIEPPDMTWNELAEGQIHTGIVTRIESYGAFVDIGAGRPGLLHVREMSDGYLEHPSELVSVGSEIEVRILRFDRQKRRIDLTMTGFKAEVADEPEEPADKESDRTTMEMALQRAYAEEQEGGPRREKRESPDFSERREILKRTVEEHGDRRHPGDRQRPSE